MANRSPNMHVFIESTKVRASDINIDIESGLQRLDTIDAEVFYSQGAQTITFNITEPLVLDGLATNHPNIMFDGSNVSIQLVVGAKSFRGTFVVLSGNLSQSANAVGQSSWTAEGQLEKFDG